MAKEVEETVILIYFYDPYSTWSSDNFLSWSWPNFLKSNEQYAAEREWHRSFGGDHHAAIRRVHQNHSPGMTPFLRPRHCRKEICRNHARDWPAIQAARRAGA